MFKYIYYCFSKNGDGVENYPPFVEECMSVDFS